MKAKNLHGAYQRVQALGGQRAAVMALQRALNGAQVGQKIFGQGVGVLRGHGVPCGLAAAERLECGGQPRVDAGEGAAVGLVLAVLVGVGRAFGQRLHGRADLHQHGRHRQFSAQVMHFGQVVAQRHVGLAGEGVFQRLGADVGVAVAVAANPLAHAQKAVYGLLAEFALEVGVELGNLAQKSRFVVAQRVFNLVGHRELAKTQQARLPELHDAGAQLHFVGG